MTETIEWRKACSCFPATATSGRTILKPIKPPDGLALDFGYAAKDTTVGYVATLHHGPVCNVCDTPWEVENESCC